MARREKPDVLMAWAPRASELMPNYKGAFKISRLGDYPTRLSYFRNTDCIVCNTPGIAERVSDLGWKREIRVISNFTGTGRVVAVDRAKLDTPADAPVVMSMGRFVERKGFHTLIEAVARLPGVYLWLLGDGEERTICTNSRRTSAFPAAFALPAGRTTRDLSWLRPMSL